MKLSLCNEVLRHLDFDRQCERAAALGCHGLELAPFTIAPDPFTADESLGQSLRRRAAAHGLAISSLHWLLVAPPGLSLTSANPDVRGRTQLLLERLIGFAAACGARVLVHGSPLQRAPQDGQTVADALARCTEAWAALAPLAQAAGVTYCIEPLSRAETPVVNTLAEAAAVVDAIGHPALRAMFDLSAAAQAETDPPHAVLARHLASGHVAHVQLNDRNRRGPGQGETPVAPVLQVLRQAGYTGWVALEPFVYQPDADSCAAASAAYVRGLWDALNLEPAE
jgi:sugar phosphate isomerase/epimerase